MFDFFLKSISGYNQGVGREDHGVDIEFGRQFDAPYLLPTDRAVKKARNLRCFFPFGYSPNILPGFPSVP